MPSVVVVALFVNATSFVPEFVRETTPVKLFELLFNVITPALPVIVTAPAEFACEIAPVCVIPTPLSESAPLPTVEAPKLSAIELVKLTSFAPELLRETAFLKIFPALVNVITPVPPLIETVPAPAVCVIAPDCVTPMPCMESVPVPSVEAPKVKLALFTKVTAFAPELLRPTAPVKLFEALFNVITPAPALMVTAPDEAACEIAAD